MKTKLMILSLIALVFLFSGISATAQTVEVTIPDMYDTTGAKIAIPIKVSDVTGLVISSYSFTLAFDPAVLEADDYSSTGALTDGWLTFLSKKTGEVIVAAAGTDTLKGSGVLVYVNFTVIGDVGSKTTVAFSQFAFNEGSPSANTNDGSFSVPKVTHGPVCGAVTATSARFVIRTDFPTQAQIFLSQDSNNWTNPVRSGIFNILAENENFVLIDVNNLTPNTTYCYTAHLAGQQQPGFIGKFKTFPVVGNAANLKILFGSCQQAYYDDPKSGFGNMFPLMAQEQADIFLHQGDWIYPDTTDSEQGDSLNFFAKHIDLLYENYRDRYDLFFPMAEMLKVMPVDFVWDDHDWVNNNCDGTYMNEGGTNSIAIYQKAFPHYPLPSASNGIWHKFTCGNTDVFMVDNRVQRDPNLNALYWHPSLNRFVFVANYMDNHSILGDEQMNWLLAELKNSKATWKFISSGTPFNPAVRGLIELALLLQGTAYDPIPDPATGSPMSMAFLAEEFSDKWAGFPSDIYKLLSGIITNDIKNVIFLSGDTHNSGIDDGANSILPELMGGPLDRTNQQVVAMSKALFKIDIWNKGGHTYDNAIPPDLGNAYGKVSVFGADSVKLEVVSEAGKTLAAHSVKAGFLPRSVAGIVVPGAIDFGTIMSDKMGGSAVVVIATSIDTFKISDIVVTPIKGKSIIVPTVKTVKLASGATKIIEFGFIPQLPEGVKIDTTLVKITFQCNDVMGEKAIYAQGVAQLTGVETADQPSIPADYNLYSCYPNPFNASTTIRFAVPKLSQVEIVVYNSLGQVVKRLAQGDYPAGNHRLEWNGSNDLNELVGSGLYFILFKTEEFQQINKTLFLK